MKRLAFKCILLEAGRKHLIAVVVLAILFMIKSSWVVLAGQTADIDKLFRSGNELFEKGDFRAAIREYSIIVNTGFVHEAVYYNLGNAYFKDGQMGRAILFYEKARKIDPQDREIRENLNMAKGRIVDKVEVPQSAIVPRLLSRLHGVLPLDVETALATMLFVGANGAYSVHLLKRKDRNTRVLVVVGWVLFSFSLLLGISNAVHIYEDHTIREAIILSEMVDVLSGPGSDHSTLFSIHNGLKVTVQNEVGEWSQVRLENGWNGWVRKDVLGLI